MSIDTLLSSEEIADGLARDLVRRIQQMRKEMDLKVDAFVDIDIVAPTAEAASSVQSRKEYISGEVRARELMVRESDAARGHGQLVRDWSIGQDAFSIGLTRHKEHPISRRPTHHPHTRQASSIRWSQTQSLTSPLQRERSIKSMFLS